MFVGCVELRLVEFSNVEELNKFKFKFSKVEYKFNQMMFTYITDDDKSLFL